MDKADSSQIVQTVAKAQGDRPLPPVHDWHPELSGDIDIRIARNGDWFHEGSRFERQALVKLFASILRKEGDEYFILTPVEKWRIQVEDAPFVITELEVIDPGPKQRLHLRTNLGDCLIVDHEHPLWVKNQTDSGEPSPYVRVRDQLDALLARPVFYRLAELAQPHSTEQGEQFGVFSCGRFFALQ